MFFLNCTACIVRDSLYIIIFKMFQNLLIRPRPRRQLISRFNSSFKLTVVRPSPSPRHPSLVGVRPGELATSGSIQEDHHRLEPPSPGGGQDRFPPLPLHYSHLYGHLHWDIYSQPLLRLFNDNNVWKVLKLIIHSTVHSLSTSYHQPSRLVLTI